MSKKIKWLGVAIIAIVLIVIIIQVIANNPKYEFDIEKDNEFIKNATYVEIYNVNNNSKSKEITKTLKVDWSNSNTSSVKSIKKSKVIAYVKNGKGKEYFLTEKKLVYTKNKKGKYTLLKSKATKIGLYENKPIVESGNKVYFIEIKNGKYIIDNTLNMEVKEIVPIDEEIFFPKEIELNKNIKAKLVFNNDEVHYENGGYLKDKTNSENIKVLYAIYVANEKESRYYIVAENMSMFVLTDTRRIELYPDKTVKSILINSKGAQIKIDDDTLVFEKK